jgi:hypothetical protein
VAVSHELPRLASGRCEAHAEYDVVESTLEQYEQIFTRSALHSRRPREGSAELVLEQPVHPLHLLLLAELNAVIREARAPLAVHSRGIRALLDRALLGEAAIALQEELRTLSPA